MNKRLTLILLAIVLCLSVALLTACGCEHYFVNGACMHCGVADEGYDPNNAPHTHFYVQGSCVNCGVEDPNYVPPAAGDGEDKFATSINKAARYGKDGDQLAVAGTVFALSSNGYYINDGTGSIFVQDATAVAVGDVVYAQGTLQMSGVNRVVVAATSAQVLSRGSTAITPTSTNVLELVKWPAVPTNYYSYINVLGFVGETDGAYTLSVEDSVINIDSASASLFQSIVGQKVYATGVISDFTNAWVLSVASADAIQIVPADLDLVADEVFAWVQTQLPQSSFLSFEVPTRYVLEPTVEFAWSVTGVDGVEIQNGNLVAIKSISGEITIPLTLTLTCDGKTKAQSFNVQVKADYVFDWAQTQLPAKMPLAYNLPTSYNNEGDITFEWSVESGDALDIASNVATINTQKATQDTTVKARLTITAGQNQMSRVFDLSVPAGGVSAYDDVVSLPVGTTAKVQGTVLLKSYDHNKKDYSMAIVLEGKMYEVAFGTNTTEWNKYKAGDKVVVTGKVMLVWDSYTGNTISRLTISCDDIVLAESAPSNYQIDITSMNVVTLATLEDYQKFVVNFDTKTGTTIVKIVNPYLVGSSTSGAGNYIRFGPDTTAASGYSTKVDGKTWKREFVFARNMLKAVCGTAFHDSLQVGAKSSSTPIQNTLEMYAIPMHLGDTTWQFVPISADFVTYTPAT